MDEIQQEVEAGLVVKSRGSVLHLAFARIEYVEVMGKTVLFHLIDRKVFEVAGSFSDFEICLLECPDFIKVHRSYIANLRHIERLETNSIITHNGHSVPVSKHLYPQFKKDFLCHLMDPAVEGKIEKSSLFPSEYQIEESYSILLVDDEQEVRERWTKLLTHKGCSVQTAEDGDTSIQLAGQIRFDCVVLDVKLGEDSGFDICGKLQKLTNAPVVFLSSLTDSSSQTQGFLSGGIDYITKDTTEELFWLKIETRIKMDQAGKCEICSGALRIDIKGRKVFLQEQELTLTTVEFDLLCLLMQHSSTVYPPIQLYRKVWGSEQWDNGQAVQMHMSRLRRKLEKAFPSHGFIETIWGEGYRFVPCESS